jgi:homoserine kinase type II
VDEALWDAVAAAYPIGPIRACVRHERVASSVARIETAEHAYWLKLITHSVGDLDTLESEAEIATELADAGVRVARAVRRRDGRYAGALTVSGGVVPALLFFESPGTEVEAPSLAQAQSLGGLLARFHAVNATAADRRWRIDDDALGKGPLRAIEAWLQRAGGDGAARIMRRVVKLEKLVDAMIEIAWPGGASLPAGLCHGDVQLENVRFVDGSPTLFDLECCGTGPCAYDLACYWRKRIGLAPADTDSPIAEWEALLRGYEQTRVLTPPERQAIPALATLRAVWVMALPAKPGTTWGQDWLLDPEYIDAHVSMIEHLASSARLESDRA